VKDVYGILHVYYIMNTCTSKKYPHKIKRCVQFKGSKYSLDVEMLLKSRRLSSQIAGYDLIKQRLLDYTT
jgi:hypothetical protein